VNAALSRDMALLFALSKSSSIAASSPFSLRMRIILNFHAW